MWKFEIPTGKYFDPSGIYVSTGYAGNGPDKDNVNSEAIIGHGPLPEAIYSMGKWFDDPEKGPIVCHLTPLPGSQMYDRAALTFMIHGDSIQHPGWASDGCCVADHPTRMAMSQSPCQFIEAVKQFIPPEVAG